MKLVGVGGPFDGYIFSLRFCGSVVWVDGMGRCHEVPGEGRLAYRKAGFHRLAFMGFGARSCHDCGAVVSADPDTGSALESCPLCGAREGAR